MIKKLLLLLSITGLLFSIEISHAKVVKLSNKGEKIVQTLCNSDKLPLAQGTIEELMEKIKTSQACSALSQKKLEAVAYYVSNGSMKSSKKFVQVPKEAKCPVCGMFVAKYPKWAARIKVKERDHYFDGVKDMMKFYIFDGNFPYDRKAISLIAVSDFYTLEEIDATTAFYVYDSNVYGPMGRELIPFKTLKNAEIFLREHQGEKILKFNEITDKMVMALDGIEQ